MRPPADVRLVDPSFADPLRALGRDDALVACTFCAYARQTQGARVVMVTDGRGHEFIEAA